MLVYTREREAGAFISVEAFEKPVLRGGRVLGATPGHGAATRKAFRRRLVSRQAVLAHPRGQPVSHNQTIVFQGALSLDVVCSQARR